LPDTVVCYLDSTVALPLLTAYALARRRPRAPKRLMDRLADLTAAMERAYLARRGAVRPE
jgi:deoxyhypusine synthase